MPYIPLSSSIPLQLFWTGAPYSTMSISPIYITVIAGQYYLSVSISLLCSHFYFSQFSQHLPHQCPQKHIWKCQEIMVAAPKTWTLGGHMRRAHQSKGSERWWPVPDPRIHYSAGRTGPEPVEVNYERFERFFSMTCWPAFQIKLKISSFFW